MDQAALSIQCQCKSRSTCRTMSNRSNAGYALRFTSTQMGHDMKPLEIGGYRGWNKLWPDARAALEGAVKDGILLAVGGFGLCGIPEALIAALRDLGPK